MTDVGVFVVGSLLVRRSFVVRSFVRCSFVRVRSYGCWWWCRVVSPSHLLPPPTVHRSVTPSLHRSIVVLLLVAGFEQGRTFTWLTAVTETTTVCGVYEVAEDTPWPERHDSLPSLTTFEATVFASFFSSSCVISPQFNAC